MDHAGYEPYKYGFDQAVKLARTLGEPSFAVAELGVAGGNGLGALDRLAAGAGMPVTVAGFDTGTGLPAPVDYRDMPYLWRGGFFGMNQAALRASTGAELVLGDVGDTAPAWLARQVLPVGFAAFDLDYYSSTTRALTGLLTGPPERYLPRVWCYFDDTVGGDEEIHSEHTGALAAIAGFNAAHEDRKLAQPNGLRWKLGGIPAAWVEGMYVLHLFTHPRYGEYLHDGRDRQVRQP